MALVDGLRLAPTLAHAHSGLSKKQVLSEDIQNDAHWADIMSSGQILPESRWSSPIFSSDGTVLGYSEYMGQTP